MIEIVWGLICALGMLAAAWGFLDAWGDLRALGERANGRRIIARGYRRAEVLRFAVHVILFGIGLPAMLNPAPVSLTPFVTGLVAVNVLLVVNSALDARDRLNVRRTAHP